VFNGTDFYKGNLFFFFLRFVRVVRLIEFSESLTGLFNGLSKTRIIL
jgi:hypothetical protein